MRLVWFDTWTKLFFLLGPIVAGLANKYGCRPLTIAGAITASLFIAVSSLSPNVDVLLVTYGIMGGALLLFIYATPLYRGDVMMILERLVNLRDM